MSTTETDVDAATGLTAQDRRRAALAACAYALDAEDARELLAALGLLEELRTGRLAS